MGASVVTGVNAPPVLQPAQHVPGLVALAIEPLGVRTFSAPPGRRCPVPHRLQGECARGRESFFASSDAPTEQRALSSDVPAQGISYFSQALENAKR